MMTALELGRKIAASVCLDKVAPGSIREMEAMGQVGLDYAQECVDEALRKADEAANAKALARANRQHDDLTASAKRLCDTLHRSKQPQD
jgi:uncharacterized membrane protein YccC